MTEKIKHTKLALDVNNEWWYWEIVKPASVTIPIAAYIRHRCPKYQEQKLYEVYRDRSFILIKKINCVKCNAIVPEDILEKATVIFKMRVL